MKKRKPGIIKPGNIKPKIFKPRIIKDPKDRGEWVESVFMARASEHGLAVSKPWGDSRSYDFVIGQVRGGLSGCRLSPRFAAQVVAMSAAVRGKGKRRIGAALRLSCGVRRPEDAWYIIPAECDSRAKNTSCLFSKSPYVKVRRISRSLASFAGSFGSRLELRGWRGCRGRELRGGFRRGGVCRRSASSGERCGANGSGDEFFEQRLERGGVDPQKR